MKLSDRMSLDLNQETETTSAFYEQLVLNVNGVLFIFPTNPETEDFWENYLNLSTDKEDYMWN